MARRVCSLGLLPPLLGGFLLAGSVGSGAPPSLPADVQQAYFNWPWGVSVDRDGRIYVADSANNRIVRVNDMTGVELTTLGKEGSGVNQFRGPDAIFVDGAGLIYIVDTGNNRIVRMSDMSGAGWTTLGERGGGNRFLHPRSLSVDKVGRIYVTDDNNRVVRVNDMEGNGWITMGTAGKGVTEFTDPWQIFVDEASRIYVADFGNNRIVRMDDMTGAGWTTLGACPGFLCTGVQEMNGPRGVFVDGAGLIYVTDVGNNRIVRMNDMTGVGWTTLGSEGSWVNRFRYLGGIAVDPQGRIYLADSGDHRVVRIDDITGKGWTTLGSASWIGPSGISVDSAGRIYIADFSNSRIVRINDMTGSGWTSFGSRGSGINEFDRPVAISVDSAGRIYVADRFNHRIVRIDDMTGAGWITLGSRGHGVNQFVDLSGIFVDGSNRIYVTDGQSSRIWRVNDMTGTGWTILDTTRWSDPNEPWPHQRIFPAGIFVDGAGRIYLTNGNGIVRMDNLTGAGWTTLGTEGNGVNQFKWVRGIFVDRAARIYVADAYNNRVVRMNDMTGAGWTTLGTCPQPPGLPQCTGSGQLSGPQAIIVGDAGRIYVADAGNLRIVSMDDMTGAGWLTMETPWFH